MAKVIDLLNALNDTMEIPLPPDFNGTVGVEYGLKKADGVTGATGTIVVEATVMGALGVSATSAAAVAAQWYPLKIHKNDETVVDNLAAPGIGFVEVTGWDKVRARMSVAGDVVVALNHRLP